MNYALAKELKDAGFPQELKHGHTTHGKIPINTKLSEIEHQKVYVPTLSELIEACGPQIECLLKRDKEKKYGENFPPQWQWGAASKDFWDTQCFGATPEEAIARLWLALQEQKKV